MSRSILFIAVGRDFSLLEQNLLHHTAFEIDWIALSVHVDDLSDNQLLDHLRSTAVRYGAEIVEMIDGPYQGTRVRILRFLEHHCDPTDWVVYADVDEFLEFPAPVSEIIEKCEILQFDFVMGEFVDRISEDGSFPVLDPGNLEGQFPNAAEVTRNVCGGAVSKVVMSRAWVNVTEGNHQALDGIGCPEEMFFIPVHHFKWDAGVLGRSVYMVEALKALERPHWVEKQRFLDMVAENGGFIKPDDPRLATRRVAAFVAIGDKRESWCQQGDYSRSGLTYNDFWNRLPIREHGVKTIDTGAAFSQQSGSRNIVLINQPAACFIWEASSGFRVLSQIVLLLKENQQMPWLEARQQVETIIRNMLLIGSIRLLRRAPRNSRSVRILTHGVVPENPTGQRHKILYIDNLAPNVEFGFGFPRSERILSWLGQQHDVTVYETDQRNKALHKGSSLKRSFVHVTDSDGNLSLRDYLLENMREIDLIWVSRPGNLRLLIDAIRGNTGFVPVVYDAEALVSIRENIAHEERGEIESKSIRQSRIAEELELMDRADVITTVSPSENRLIQNSCGSPVVQLGSPHPLAPTDSNFESRRDLLLVQGFFLGQSRSSSIDYFCRDIFPGILRKIDCSFNLYGYRSDGLAAPELSDDCSRRIRFHGAVDSLWDVYDSHRLFVIPTTCAAGVPWKAIEAMAHGIPLVVTPLVAGQLELDENTLLIGHTSDEFSDKVVQLYQDVDLWHRLRKSGFDYIRRNCNEMKFRQTLKHLVNVACSGQSHVRCKMSERK